MLTKKLSTGISLLAAMGMMAMGPAAYAQSNMTDIVNTGSGVSVNSSSNTSSTANVSNSNKSSVVQEVNANVDTGHNDANSNISMSGATGGISTGNAGVNVGLAVDANRNMTAVAGFGSQGGTNTTDIVNTGSNTSVDASTNTTSNVYVENKNKSYVDQSVYAHMNTGGNDANKNIGAGGEITTGVAAANVGLNVVANKNETGIGTGAGMQAATDGANHTVITNTGSGLHSNTNVNTQTQVNSKSTNYLSAIQSLYAHENTGKNDANKNIGGAATMTGMAGISTGASVSGNHNTTFIGSLWDMLMGWMS